MGRARQAILRQWASWTSTSRGAVMRILQVMARAYTEPDGLDAAIAFYEKLFGERCKARFPIPPLGLEIASVGSVHLLAGVEEKLKPFRSAQATF